MERIRTQHPKAYQKWTDEDDNLLLQRYKEGMDVVDLAELFQRQLSAIQARLAKLREM